MLPWLLALFVLAGLVYVYSRRNRRPLKADHSEIEDELKDAFRSRASDELSRSCEKAAGDMDSEGP